MVVKTRKQGDSVMITIPKDFIISQLEKSMKLI